VELDHLDVVGKGVNWKFYTFCNGYKVRLVGFALVGLEDSESLDVSTKGLVKFELAESEAAGLLVEKSACVEHCLAIFSSHLIEEKCLVRLPNSP